MDWLPLLNFPGRDSVSPPAFRVSTEKRVTGVGVQRSPWTAASWSGVPGDLWLCRLLQQPNGPNDGQRGGLGGTRDGRCF